MRKITRRHITIRRHEISADIDATEIGHNMTVCPLCNTRLAGTDVTDVTARIEEPNARQLPGVIDIEIKQN